MFAYGSTNLLNDDEEIRVFVSALDLQERLDPWNSFFGGRTNAVKLRHETQENGKITPRDTGKR